MCFLPVWFGHIDIKLQRLLTLVFLFNCLLANIAQADLVVVTHKDNQIIEVTREQVVYLFTGREQNFANGNPAVIIDQASDSRVRIDFYQLLLGKTVAQMNAYWARLLFTGNATPPKVLNYI